MNKPPEKLCVHCRHFVQTNSQPENGLCGRSAKIYNPVTGENRHRFAENERENPSPTACGPDGQFFSADNFDVAV